MRRGRWIYHFYGFDDDEIQILAAAAQNDAAREIKAAGGVLLPGPPLLSVSRSVFDGLDGPALCRLSWPALEPGP